MSENDDIKALREAIAAGPTRGPWTVTHELRQLDEAVADLVNDTWVIAPPGAKLGSWLADAALIAAASPDRITRILDRLEAAEAEVQRLTAENEALRHENHNLNWALGTEGYSQMATPEEQAEHEEGVRRIQVNLDRLAAEKAKVEANERDAELWRMFNRMMSGNDSEIMCNAAGWGVLRSVLIDTLAQAEKGGGNG